MAGLLRGKKVSGRHQTFIQSAKSLIQAAQKCDAVKKIVIGPIQPIHGKTKEIRISRTPTSIQADVFSGNEKQTFWLVGNCAAIYSSMRPSRS